MKLALLISLFFMGIYTLDSLHKISNKLTPAPCYTKIPKETWNIKFIPGTGENCFAGIVRKDTIEKVYSIKCIDTVLNMDNK